MTSDDDLPRALFMRADESSDALFYREPSGSVVRRRSSAAEIIVLARARGEEVQSPFGEAELARVAADLVAASIVRSNVPPRA